MKTLAYAGLTWLFIIGSQTAIRGQNKFALSVSVAPVYNHSDTHVTLPIADPVRLFPFTEFTTKGNGLGYSLGLLGRYAFTPKWSALMGIWATHAVSGKTDISENGVLFTDTYRYNHPFTNFYRLPLIINYQSSTRRLSPYFSVGASLDFRGKTYVDLSGNGELVAVKFGKPVVATSLIGAGAIYKLTHQLSLIAQPTLQYNLQPHSGYSYYHSYQLSLQTQLLYQF